VSSIYYWRFGRSRPPQEVLDELEKFLGMVAAEVASAQKALAQYRIANPPKSRKIRRRKSLTL
jgi:hypothetical protein